MSAPGYRRLALPLLFLAVVALAEGDAKGLKEGETPGNFMEDEQWLSSISQYSGKIKHWNRFRDVSGGAGRAGPGAGSGREAGSRDPERAGSNYRVSEPEPLRPAELTAPRVNNTESSNPAPLSCLRGHRHWDLQPRSLSKSPRRGTCSEGARSRQGLSGGLTRNSGAGCGDPGPGCCWAPPVPLLPSVPGPGLGWVDAAG